jgi:hypothetical protein
MTEYANRSARGRARTDDEAQLREKLLSAVRARPRALRLAYSVIV